MGRQMFCSRIIDPLFFPSIISRSKLFHIHLYSLFIYKKFVDVSYRSNAKSLIDVKNKIIVLGNFSTANISSIENFTLLYSSDI